MKLYAAGNFVFMKDPEKEMKFIEEVKKRGFESNRLVSFFFQKELQTVLEIKDKEKTYENQ